MRTISVHLLFFGAQGAAQADATQHAVACDSASNMYRRISVGNTCLQGTKQILSHHMLLLCYDMCYDMCL
jgi:hypothetical protein